MIANPNFEKYFVAYSPILNNERHDISSVRAHRGFTTLSFSKLDMTQRIVAGFNYRDEEYETDYYLYALDPAEMARRGLTGAAARFQNAKVYPVHYLEDGNSDEAPGPQRHARRDDVVSCQRGEQPAFRQHPRDHLRLRAR
jgi:hypothetical protein